MSREHRGIIEKIDPDGTRSFTGPGGGVLWFGADGEVWITPVEKAFPLRVRLLLEVAAKHMPARPIEIEDVAQYKGEALVMLEALRTKDTPFFRALCDAIKPRNSALKTAKAHAISHLNKDNNVLGSISDAAKQAGDIPQFDDILAKFRTTKGNSSETPSSFKKRLRARGFGWLCGD